MFQIAMPAVGRTVHKEVLGQRGFGKRLTPRGTHVDTERGRRLASVHGFGAGGGGRVLFCARELPLHALIEPLFELGL